MNLLSPRYRKQRSRLFVLCVIFCSGALGYPSAARAQNEAPPQGSQPAVVPAAVVSDKAAPENLPKAEPPKVDAAVPDAPKVDEPKPEAPKAVAAAARAATPSAGGKSYIIGVNDLISVKVWNQPQISGMVDVHVDGMISIPLAGEIKADGLTAVQLKDAITRRLEEVALTAPEVDVSVMKINSKHYSVYGGVLHGGTFVLAEKVTIMDALALAVIKDGFAKTNKIELRRGKGKPLLFNQKDYLKGKNMDKNIDYELQDGDQIIVPE